MKNLNLFGEGAVFHHVGLAVNKISDTGINDLKIFEDPIQKIRGALVSVGGCCIELLEPTTEDSPIQNGLKKNKGKLLHLCYEVTNLSIAVEEAKKNKFRLLSEAVPAALFNSRKIVWVYHPAWGLFELLEK